VWQGNPQVQNPDLIYPGDVLVMTFIDGKPVLRALQRETVRLSPTARPSSFVDAIAPIDPRAIQAYINAPLVTDENELATAGYIVDGVNNRLLMGKYDQFYARGVDDKEAKEYRVFRPGRHFIAPVSQESLGWEAEHVGDARMLKAGAPARLTWLTPYTVVSVRDRLRPVYKKERWRFFYPKAPDNEKIRGVILDMPNESAELGALSVGVLNLGEREGIKAGDVFRILSQAVPKVDPMTGEKYSIPEEKVGLILVFRTFNKVSYGIITNSNRQITAGDIVVSPNQQ
jgi:hypothetical protein